MRHLTIALLSLCVTASASAATIVVSKTGAITTIQAGVDAASAGDTVLVKAGNYAELVTIPAPHTGLVLKGSGLVVIDRVDETGASIAQGNLLTVLANGVTVDGFLLRHAFDPGAGEAAGIRIQGSSMQIRNCKVIDSEGAAFDVAADFGTIEKCLVSRAKVGFKGLNSHGWTIRLSTLRHAIGDLIQVNGADGFTVEKCVLTGSKENAIEIDGVGLAALAFRKNVVRNCLGGGMVISAPGGAPIEINKNAFSDTVSGPIITDGGTLDIRANSMFGAGDGDGIFTANATAGGAIVGNKGEAIHGTFIVVSGQNFDVRDNKCRDMNNEGQEAFRITGAGSTVTNCEARECANDAFRIQGNDIVLKNCRAFDSAKDGFDVAASAVGVSFVKCKAQDCQAEGFENSGANTNLSGCTAKLNRIDFANDGTIAAQGIVFGTGGANFAPQID